MIHDEDSCESDMNPKKIILETTKDLIGLKVRDVKLGHGSFLTMGFDKDIEYTLTIRRKSETRHRAEWYLWIQSSNWELHLNESGEDLVCSARDDRAKIAEGITLLEGLTLQEIKIWPSLSLTIFMFGNYGPQLAVHTPEWYQNKDFADWILFTPEQKVLCVKYMCAWIEDE